MVQSVPVFTVVWRAAPYRIHSRTCTLRESAPRSCWCPTLKYRNPRLVDPMNARRRPHGQLVEMRWSNSWRATKSTPGSILQQSSSQIETGKSSHLHAPQNRSPPSARRTHTGQRSARGAGWISHPNFSGEGLRAKSLGRGPPAPDKSLALFAYSQSTAVATCFLSITRLSSVMCISVSRPSEENVQQRNGPSSLSRAIRFDVLYRSHL